MMPRYVVTRILPPRSEILPLELAERSAASARGLPGVAWFCCLVSVDGRRAFDELEAPSPQLLHDHAVRVGLPVESIVEVSGSYAPRLVH